MAQIKYSEITLACCSKCQKMYPADSEHICAGSPVRVPVQARYIFQDGRMLEVVEEYSDGTKLLKEVASSNSDLLKALCNRHNENILSALKESNKESVTLAELAEILSGISI